MNWTVVPIEQWPGEHTNRRKHSPFRKQNGRGWMESGVNWSSTMDTLGRELRELQAKDVLLQMAVTYRDIRNDGWIRANARPQHPGVILTFESKHGPLSYPCDRFNDWQANVRAIALALEALRKVDRYGVTRRGEQYTGWKRLPSQTSAGAESTLAKYARVTVNAVRRNPKQAYRLAAKNTHPDRAGSPDAFNAVTDAARALGVA